LAFDIIIVITIDVVGQGNQILISHILVHIVVFGTSKISLLRLVGGSK
jgi:hypothetical protein